MLKMSDEYKKAYSDAIGKCDEQIDKLFFELKEMKDLLKETDWTQRELAGGMLALSILKRTIRELFLMEVSY